MRFVKHFHRAILCILLICGFADSAQGKSVYVINNTEESQLQVYKIEGTNLIYQADYTCKFDPPDETGDLTGVVADECYFGLLWVYS